MTPHTMLLEKKARPLGHVKLLFWKRVHTSGILDENNSQSSFTPLALGRYGQDAYFPNVQFMTATCTKLAQIVATSWAVNAVLGGTFM